MRRQVRTLAIIVTAAIAASGWARPPFEDPVEQDLAQPMSVYRALVLREAGGRDALLLGQVEYNPGVGTGLSRFMVARRAADGWTLGPRHDLSPASASDLFVGRGSATDQVFVAHGVLRSGVPIGVESMAEAGSAWSATPFANPFTPAPFSRTVLGIGDLDGDGSGDLLALNDHDVLFQRLAFDLDALKIHDGAWSVVCRPPPLLPPDIVCICDPICEQTGNPATQARMDDVDGDGHMDLVYVSDGAPSTVQVRAFAGSGAPRAWSFDATVDVRSGGGPFAVEQAPSKAIWLPLDGKPGDDLLALVDDRIEVRYARGDRMATGPKRAADVGLQSLDCTAAWRAAGALVACWRSVDDDGSFAPNLLILEVADGDMRRLGSVPCDPCRQARLGDFDGDGTVDLVVTVPYWTGAEQSARLRFHRGTSGGSGGGTADLGVLLLIGIAFAARRPSIAARATH